MRFVSYESRQSVHLPITGKIILRKQSPSQIVDIITKMPGWPEDFSRRTGERPNQARIRKIVDAIKREGFVRMRIDGQVVTADEELELDPKRRMTSRL